MGLPCKKRSILIFLASYIIYGMLGYNDIIIPSTILWNKIFGNILYIFPILCYILFPIYILRNVNYKYLVYIYLVTQIWIMFSFYSDIYTLTSDNCIIDLIYYGFILISGGVFLLQTIILPALLTKECLKYINISKLKFIMTLSLSVIIILITPFIVLKNLEMDNSYNSKYLTKYKNCIKSFGPPDILNMLENRHRKQ